MKQTDFFNMIFSERYINHHVKHTKTLLESSDCEFTDQVLGIKMDAYSHSRNHYNELVLSSKVQSMLDHIKVDKGIKWHVLRSLPNRSNCVLVDKNTVIRYIKGDHLITIIHDVKTEFNGTLNGFSLLDLKNEINLFGKKVDEYGLDHNKMEDTFFKVITFLEMTDPTLKIVYPKSKIREGFVTYKNHTNLPYTLVTTNWNQHVIRIGETDVRGHYRLQPYGEGRLKYKYIYIQPFKRGITQKLPQKTYQY